MAKTKKQIVAELEEINEGIEEVPAKIQFDEKDTAKNLAAILKKAKAEAEVKAKAQQEAEGGIPGDPPGPPDEPPTPPEPPKKGKFKVLDANGNLYPRTFAKLEDAEAMAEEIRGRVKK